MGLTLHRQNGWLLLIHIVPSWYYLNRASGSVRVEALIGSYIILRRHECECVVCDLGYIFLQYCCDVSISLASLQSLQCSSYSASYAVNDGFLSTILIRGNRSMAKAFGTLFLPFSVPGTSNPNLIVSRCLEVMWLGKVCILHTWS